MDSYKLSGFLDIFKDSIKILSSKGKLVALTAIIYLLLDSLLFLLNTFSTKPFIYDLLFKIISLSSTRPNTPEYAGLLAAIRQDVGFFLGIQTLYLIPFFFISLFAKTAIILISSSLYTENDLSLKELVFKISRTWIRPFLTSITIELLSLGYMSLFVLPFLIPTLVLYDYPVPLTAILALIAVVFFTWFFYLSVSWVLSIVVSVVEEVCGVSAIGKAKEVVVGKRLHGIFVNLVAMVFSGGVVLIGTRLQSTRPIVVGIIQVLFACIAYIFQSVTYTVLYFQCRNDQKRSGGGQYSAIPASAPVEDYIP